jgi:hypothetical protein
MNEQALMQILSAHLRVTELLLEDYLRLAQKVQEFSPSPELLDMIPTIRAQRQRAEAIVGL